MKLVCSKRNINNPKIEQISKEITKLDKKEYFHVTLYFDEDKSKYIRIHFKSIDKYILNYCDGSSEDYLQEEKANLSHDEILAIIRQSIENDFSWVPKLKWITFKRGEPLEKINSSVIKTITGTSVFIIASILALRFKLEFYLGLFVILLPFIHLLFSLISRKNESTDVTGAQKVLNDFWSGPIFPVTFLIIARNINLHRFWTILSWIHIFFLVITILVLVNYSRTKPYSGRREKPIIDFKKKRKKAISKIAYRTVLVAVWFISWGFLEQFI